MQWCKYLRYLYMFARGDVEMLLSRDREGARGKSGDLGPNAGKLSLIY